MHSFLNGRSATVAVASLLYLLRTAPARAEVEPVRLVYQAYEACPSEAAFVRDVEGRTEHARTARSDEPARVFVVAVSPDGDGSRGFLQITDMNGEISRRDVSGATCNDVVSALAFMTLLAIDPEAVPAGPISAPKIDETRTERPSTSPPLETPRWRWGTGLEGQVLGGFVPGAAPGGGVFLDLSSPEPGILSPSFRVSVLGATTLSLFTSAIGAQLTWLTARVEGCPARARVASLEATACLAMDAGVMFSEGVALASLNSDSRPWFVPGAMGRLTWPLKDGLWIEGAAGLGLPLERYRFEYQGFAANPVQVFRIPILGADFGLGAGYRFP